MNLKIALATAILLTGGVYATHAQQKTAQATVVTAQSFNKEITNFQNATDPAKAASLLNTMKQQMADGARSGKSEMMKSGNEQVKQKMVTRSLATDKVISLSKDINANKAAILKELKAYAATL